MTPMPGYKVNTCNMLRLWKAEACESFDFQSFNVGDYYGAVDEKVASENLTKVLFQTMNRPKASSSAWSNSTFLSPAACRDMIRMHLMIGRDNLHIPRTVCRAAQRYPSGRGGGRNSCDSWWTNRVSTGNRPGR